MSGERNPDTDVLAPHIAVQGRAPQDADAVTTATPAANLAGANGTRPPFQDKNLAALKIGYRSPRVYGKVAEGIVAELLEAEPHLAQYPEELAALAQTEAIVALIRLELAARGIGTGDGVRLALLDRYFKAEASAAKRRDAVGLSPLGDAVLAKERAAAAALTAGAAVDLATLARQGEEAFAARDRADHPDLVQTVLVQEREAYAIERAAAAEDWTAQQEPHPDQAEYHDEHHHDREDDR